MRYRHKKTLLDMFRSAKLMRLIHAALVMHLLLIGTIFAVVFGALTYHLRSEELAEGVLATVRQQANILRVRIKQLAAEKKLSLPKSARIVLAEEPPHKGLDRRGRFVSVEICGPDGVKIPVWSDPDRHVPVKDDCHSQGKESDRPASVDHDILRHEGQLYVLVRTPISANSERAEGVVHTTFLLSAGTRKELEREGIDRALLAAVIVFLATLAVYPAIVLLARRTGKLAEKLLHSNLEMMQVLGSAVAKRDADTDEHNYRVSLYSVRLAEAVKLGRSEMRRLLKGAFLHDIGKIGIPDGILRKPGRLTDDEIEVMRRHVPLGLDIIFRSFWLRDAADVVGCHHERVDGTGYPNGIAGDDIPLTARIFAIADVFDALCSKRPYKEALPADHAIGIMRRESGRHFDRRLLGVFESIAFDLHARYADRDAGELRRELNSVLAQAFSGSITTMGRR